MSQYVFTFGYPTSVIASNKDGEIKMKKYDALSGYGAKYEFKSAMRINQLGECVVGESVKLNQGSDQFIIEDIGRFFKNSDQSEKISIHGRTYHPDDLVKLYFSKVKEAMDTQANQDAIDSCMMIIPYEFNASLKQRLKTILKQIHFYTTNLIEEPFSYYTGIRKGASLHTFLMVDLQKESIHIKLFEVNTKNKKNHFKLLGNSYHYQSIFKDYYESIANDCLKNCNLTYDALSKNDQNELMNGEQGLLLAMQVINQRESDRYEYVVALEDAAEICEGTLSATSIQQALKEYHILDRIIQMIEKTLMQSNKLKGQIKSIFFAGSEANLLGIQEGINDYFHLSQQIILEQRKITCEGAIHSQKESYECDDYLKKVGVAVRNGFYPMVAMYGNVKERSLVRSLPSLQKDQQMTIYEGYRDASIKECTWLKNIVIKKIYFDGQHKIMMERKSGGEINMLITNQNLEVQESIRIK